MNCPKCNEEVKDTWKVCPVCMQPLPASLKCQKCGAELKPSWKACPECGTPNGATVPQTGSGQTAETDTGSLQAGSKKTFEVKGVAFDFCWIPSGEFLMGSETSIDSKPVHKVQITKGFWLGRTPVTQGQRQVVMGVIPTNPDSSPNGDDYPVGVLWNDIQEFIGNLNQLTDKRFRLPTEAEWEYACRAGISGDNNEHLYSYAWLDYKPHPVGLKHANRWGLHDMLGFGEWCQDWYDEQYYVESPIQDPPGPVKSSTTRPVLIGEGEGAKVVHLQLPNGCKVIRGNDDPKKLSAASRCYLDVFAESGDKACLRLVMEP